MKKISAVVLLSALLGFIVVPRALALTSAEIQATINQLQQQINALKQQMVQAQSPAGWCHTFNTNLKIGDSGTDVEKLKTALQKSGIWPAGGINNSFDEETASYIVAFQEKYKAEILAPYGLKNGTGYFGPSTRKKINSLYGCSADSGLTCAQVITYAKDSSGQCKSFSTPCNVPSGWTMVNSCPVATPTPTPGASSSGCVDECNYIGQKDASGKVCGNYDSDFCFEWGPSAANATPGPQTTSSAGAALTVLYPNGGEKWVAGGAWAIKWKSSNISNKSQVVIEFQRDLAAVNPVKKYTGLNSGIFIIDGLDLDPGYDYKVKVSYGQVQDQSDNYFSVVSQ